MRTTLHILTLAATAFGLAWLLGQPLPAAAQSAASGAEEPAELRAVQLRKEGERLNVHFLLSAPPKMEVVDNLPKQVLVVKFRDAVPGIPEGKDRFLFNDPMVAGIVLEAVGPRETWAKVRLRKAALTYTVTELPTSNQVVISVAELPPSDRIGLEAVRVATEQTVSRVVLDLTRLPTFESDQVADRFLVRLSGVVSRLQAALEGGDERVELSNLEEDGDDTLLRIQLLRPNLESSAVLLDEPPQLVFVFRDAAEVAATPAGEAAGRLAEEDRPESVEVLLAAEPNPAVRATYTLAEREMRAGRYDAARSDFIRVFTTTPRSKLGVRAYFRAADAQYEILRAENARNYHGAVTSYQAAIRAAETANYDSDLIPRAFFQIARSYQHMDFHHESDAHFRILQDRFPGHPIYTPDSFFYQGQSYARTRKHEAAIATLQEFLSRDGDPALVAPAFYLLGDAFYQQRRYAEAKQQFDRARRNNPDYAKDHPVLLFHMGETYYENAEFDIARTIYNTLLERYPAEPFSKLVGLRLGDFLRDEGKEADALRIYREVIRRAPLEIWIRGKMRIANIFANRPVGDDFRRALAEYDDIIARGEQRPVVQEAVLRKALTLTLHNRNQEAVDTFEKLVETYPDSPYIRNKIVENNVVENLKSMVDRLFAEEQYWEIAKLYTKNRAAYFRDFRYETTLFQVARSYHYLGLYDEALRLYDRILERGAGSMASLIEYQRALAHSQKDQLGPAEAALLKFIQERPEDRYLVDAKLQLGKVRYDGRRFQEALRAFRLLERDFEQGGEGALAEAEPEVYYRLGLIHKELGQLGEAVEAFRAAVENFHHPLQGEDVPQFLVLSHYAVGDVLFDMGQDQEALAAYRLAMQRYPDHEKTPWARFQIGLIHRRNGREREALEVFNGLVELAKTQPGELWETLAKENQRDLVNSLGYQDYLKQ